MKRVVSAFVVTSLVLAGAAAWAQSSTPPLPDAGVPPHLVMLPNYDTVPVGENGSLQAGAYVARARDASAVWFNPAGLAGAEKSSVSGTAGMFQLVSVLPEGIQGTGGSFQQMPAAVGVLIKEPFGLKRWSGGFQVTSTGNWNVTGNVQREVPIGSTIDRFRYSTSASFGGLIASAAAGYEFTRTLRLGFSLDWQRTTWTATNSWADDYRKADGLSSLLIDARSSASAVHARVTAGAQYEASPAVRLAAVVRSPGIGLCSSGERYQDGLATIGATKISASLFEQDGRVTFRVPIEVRFGAAWVRPRGEIEIDLLAHGNGGIYEAFRGSAPILVVRDSGTGDAPAVQEYQANASTVDSTAVVNIAVGGQFKLTANGSWRIHGGFATDRSPVGPSDTLFTKVNMYASTLGISVRTRIVFASFGVRYESGLSEPFSIRRLQNGEPYMTRLRVRNVGFLYSIAFTL